MLDTMFYYDGTQFVHKLLLSNFDKTQYEDLVTQKVEKKIKKAFLASVAILRSLEMETPANKIRNNLFSESEVCGALSEIIYGRKLFIDRLVTAQIPRPGVREQKGVKYGNC